MDSGIVLTIAATHVDRRLQALLKDENNQLRVDDAAKIVGCWKALSKQGLTDDLVGDHDPMHRAVAFCQVIEASHGKKTHKVSSKNIANMFQAVVEGYQASEPLETAVQLTCEGKQKIVVELYDKFFRNAFPEMTERLGIVYTPVPVVDFIINSVNEILVSDFGQTLGSEGVHIIDPFTGTGTFITRMLQSGLITTEELKRKYRKEIHANEIVLLAYYIAAVNIEAVYHSLVGGKYELFEGICLADTFQLYEREDLISKMLVDNNARRKRQKTLDIRVIVGNPPYTSGDKNDTNNKSIDYPTLDERISDTYVKQSAKTVGKSKMYDSYIRAIRWASDRVGNSGVIGFVTNAGFLENNTTDGLRKSLAAEFSDIYVFHLRGNAYTKGERRRKEKDNVFGLGSRAAIAIFLLVKNPHAEHPSRIRMYDIGDYLTKDEKLAAVSSLKDISGISAGGMWQNITPDAHGDWFGHRDDEFQNFIQIGDKSKSGEEVLFSTYSMGIKSNRDDWVYSFSEKALRARIASMIDFYNSEVARYKEAGERDGADGFVSRDKTKIKWTSDVLADLENGRERTVDSAGFVKSMYRPFTKEWVYSNKVWNWSRHLMHTYFPSGTTENRVICVTGTGETTGFSALMVDVVPNLHTISTGQCFPLFVYEEEKKKTKKAAKATPGALFGAVDIEEVKVTRNHALTDDGLASFRSAYPKEHLQKDDIFYYVYGVLHSPDYRKRFADDLAKSLPRIPCVKTASDFWAFCKAGRDLAELHLNYETVEMYPLKVQGKAGTADTDYRVKKMRYGKGPNGKDLTTLHYNDYITLSGIPLEAYGYTVNGVAALDWIVERQTVSTDKTSGIVDDANSWASETVNNPRYPLELFQRMITVSLGTLAIVNALPALQEAT